MARAFVLVLVVSVMAVGASWWTTGMPGRSHAGPLPPFPPSGQETATRLRVHVERLAGAIGERNVWREGSLEAAAEYLEGAFRDAGHEPVRESFPVGEGTAANVYAELGDGEEIVIVGAHYDSVPGSPGADDNASGVAALLEVARLLGDTRPRRIIRFVAFANEEAPFYGTSGMGSVQHARGCIRRGERIAAMFSLESIGFYSDREGSQRYPAPFSFFYPSRADFIGFVGNLGSRDLVRRTTASFRRHAAFPSEGAALPSWIMGVSWSDHASFWREGFPALMVTGTALFRNPHYHEPSDLPDTLDYERLARVTTGLVRVVREEANR